MKKYLNILLITVLLNSSCSDFLELDESEYNTTEFQFSTFERAKLVATNVYGYVNDELMSIDGTMRDAATDDALNVWDTNRIKKYYDGSWSASSLIDDMWGHYYTAISQANYFLENCPNDYPESQYLTDYKERMVQLRNYPREIKVLRAYFHFELLKRYNSIVIADRSLNIEEVNKLIPSTYQDVAAWIVAQCDEVIPDLPTSYAETKESEIARVTKGMAIALKSRVLLYAASPLNNPSLDKAKWLQAAQGAKDLIDLNIYKLADEAITNNAEAKGLIFGKWNTISNLFEIANFPIGYEGGYTGICPTQNLAEAFDMIDGTPFDWNNETHRYKMLMPLERDPRLIKTILLNGQEFKGQLVESYINGKNGLPKTGASPTAYYLRKHVREETVLTTGSAVAYQHIFPLFRYAEIYLNYAEALFEATKDPNFKGSESGVTYTLSPMEAVNLVRSRAGMPNLPANLTDDTFRDRMRNERRVEFAFEGHRFWDIRRWKIGDKTNKIYGLTINRSIDASVNYSKKVVQNRIWDDKMNFYPIADSEIFKNSNLIQNKGW